MFILRAALILVFIGFLNIGVDIALQQVVTQGMPILPPNVACLVAHSGILIAINRYIQIIIFGWTLKMALSFISG